MIVATPEPRYRHGTSSGYGYHGCRCDECRAYASRYQMTWRQRRRDGCIPFKRARIVAGSKITVPKTIRTVRDMMREHLALDRKTIKYDLARMLAISSQGARSLMCKKHPLAPQHIDAFIKHMQLDEFDAYALRRQGAIEAGWQLHLEPKG